LNIVGNDPFEVYFWYFILSHDLKLSKPPKAPHGHHPHVAT
jgi:hypothetical protein